MMPSGATTMNPDGSITTVGPNGEVVTTPPPNMTATPPGDGTNLPPGMDPTMPAATDMPVDPIPAPDLPEELVPLCEPGIPATTQVPRLLNAQYDNVVRDLLGVTTLANGSKPSDMLSDDSEGPIDTFIWNAYQDVAAQISSEVIAGANKANFISCDPAAVATCYEDTIRAFGRKAFRHPMSDEEVARFMTLTTIEPAGTADEIAEALLYAFLVSPSFIMTPEMAGTADATTGAIPLSSHEIAMRLSLAVWGSVPDDALNEAADTDALQDPVQILTHATRMLQDRAKAGPQVSAAHRNYLMMDDQSHWWKVSHSHDADYSDDIRPALKTELDMFFEELAYTGGSFKDLFLSNVGFVNQDTAALYGLDPSAYGPELVKAELENRPGFLTRAGFLSSFANAEVTSPILRGAFITINVLSVDPGAPDPDALLTELPDREYTTRREQIEALTEPADCQVCHQQFVNPPGYALENFDAVGKWQTTDPLGGAIDASAAVAINTSSTVDVAGALDLMNAIAGNAKSAQLYATRMVSAATGRFPNPQDGCIVDDVTAKLVATPGYTVLNLLADVTQAESFRLRTVGN
jgi:hypothetical protein